MSLSHSLLAQFFLGLLGQTSLHVLFQSDQAVFIDICRDEKCGDVLLLQIFMQRAHFRSIDEVVLIDIECNEVLFVPCNIVIFFLVASTVTSTSSVKEIRIG